MSVNKNLSVIQHFDVPQIAVTQNVALYRVFDAGSSQDCVMSTGRMIDE
jgi:hypothetical protein